MSDFFGRLEAELRAAAERPRGRAPVWAESIRGGGRALLVAVVLAVALVPVLVVLGGAGDQDAGKRGEIAPAPIGTVIPKGEGTPPRQSDSTVVATGRAPVAGPFQLEVSRGSGVKNPETGEVYLRRGGACLTLYPLDPPGPGPGGGGGYCGPTRKLGFRKTPGFSRQQTNMPALRRQAGGRLSKVDEVLIFGVVPERAAAVVITSDRVRLRVKPDEGPRGQRRDFYVIPVRPGFKRGRINWIDRDGDEGSRGIGLLPPLD